MRASLGAGSAVAMDFTHYRQNDDHQCLTVRRHFLQVLLECFNCFKRYVRMNPWAQP